MERAIRRRGRDRLRRGAAPDRRTGLRQGFAALHAQGERLFHRMWHGIASLPGVTAYGPPPGTPRTPTIGFTVAGKSSEQVAIALAEQGVFVSHGDFYAVTVVERLGVEGLVRAGCACYTSQEEVQRLVNAVGQVAADGS